MILLDDKNVDSVTRQLLGNSVILNVNYKILMFDLY